MKRKEKIEIKYLKGKQIVKSFDLKFCILLSFLFFTKNKHNGHKLGHDKLFYM